MGESAPTLDQLADTRREMLQALKAAPRTMAELAATLRMSTEAVRQQLAQLEKSGWVARRSTRGASGPRGGRPAVRYVLTPAGEELFPKRYHDLSVALLDGVSDSFGAEAVRALLERITDARVAQFAPSLDGLTLLEKVAALKDLYILNDPYVSVDTSPGSVMLIERNCPYLKTALQRPALCSTTVSMLTRLLGKRVVREQRYQDGDGRCVFRVLMDETVDPPAFAMEPPRTDAANEEIP
jgi:predicted ArsR family transcriptional regulator